MVFMRLQLKQLVASYLSAQAFQSFAAWARERNQGQGLNSLDTDSIFAIWNRGVTKRRALPDVFHSPIPALIPASARYH